MHINVSIYFYTYYNDALSIISIALIEGPLTLSNTYDGVITTTDHIRVQNYVGRLLSL